jgi:predicted XRE-type DNA-binding protein
MARQRVSHKQVAEWLGISQPQISRRLRCEIPFRTTELETIAERLAVPVTQFFPSTAPVSAA